MIKRYLLVIIAMAIPFFTNIFIFQSIYKSDEWTTKQFLIFIFFLLSAYGFIYAWLVKNTPKWLDRIWYK